MNNILLFVESGLGNSALITDQLLALHRQHKDVYAVLGNKSQEVGLIDKIASCEIPYSILDGLSEHNQFVKDAVKLKDIIENERINVVHVQTNWELALVTYVKYFMPCKKRFKIIYTIHAFRNNKPFQSYIARFLITIALWLFSDKVICTCTFLKKKFRLLSYKISLIPLGISDAFFENDYVRHEKDGLHLIFPAQFREGKNQDLIIQAFAKYVESTQDQISTLVLPGSGVMLYKMKKLVGDLGLEKQIIFPGLCTKAQILELYAQSNVAVISSNCETFGQCIVEPFVLGMPILTTRVGVAPDIIKDGINGFYFKNSDELFDKLLKLSADPMLLQKMGATNYDERNLFRWSVVTKQYLESITQMMMK